MERTKTKSSVVAGIGYDPASRILEVELMENGQVKRYLDVDIQTWERFIACTSIGQFYLRYIDGFYEEFA